MLSCLKLSLAFQKAILPSFAHVMSVLLSVEKQRLVIKAWWPLRWAISERITRSHTLSWQSSAEERRSKVSYSGKNVRLVMIPRWPPVKLWVWKPLITSNTLIELSAVPAAKNFEVGSKASSRTIWPVVLNYFTCSRFGVLPIVSKPASSGSANTLIR